MLVDKNIKWHVLKLLMGRTFYEKIRSKRFLGYAPDLKNPRSFNEKIIRRKLYNKPSCASVFADKYAVRDFVSQKIGDKFLNPLLFVGDHPNEIPFADLPDKFVVKTTHNSGDVIIVRDKKAHDLAAIKKQVSASLNKHFGDLTNETWYTEIKPRIIVETLLEDKENEIPPDYKFFCFHGKCKLIQVDHDRFGAHKRSFYDTEWNIQPFSYVYPKAQETEAPENLAEMKEIAEKLAKGYDFIRIDLYSVNGKTIFGEITYAPEAGWGQFEPRDADYEIGKLW